MPNKLYDFTARRNKCEVIKTQQIINNMLIINQYWVKPLCSLAALRVLR